MESNIFAQIPFYMLQDYGTELGLYYDLTDSSSTIDLGDFSPVIFVDGTVDGNSELGFLDGNGEYTRTHTNFSIKNARIIGPGHHIVVDGGSGTRLYVEKENFGYRKVAVRPQGYSDGIDDNGFKFDLIEQDKLQRGIGFDSGMLKEVYDEYGGTIESRDDSWTIIKDIVTNGTVVEVPSSSVQNISTIEPVNIAESQQGKSFAVKNYVRKNQEFTVLNELVPEDTFFFRKDSHFFEWYRKKLKYLGNIDTNYGTRVSSTINSTYDTGNHENFLNDNLMFTYFGGGLPIHHDINEGQIQHHSMKNFMLNSLPPNDMNATNRALIGESMDRVYEEPYNMARNITTLLDPKEIPQHMLAMLGSFYDVNVIPLLNEFNSDIREFISALPLILKKKGTQASLIQIGRSIIGSKNKVSFFERGHEAYASELITGISLELLETGAPPSEAVKPGGGDGTEGGGPPAIPDQGFPNPMSFENYVVLYLFGKTGSEYKSEVYGFGDNTLEFMRANNFTAGSEYLQSMVQHTKFVAGAGTYIPGIPLFTMDVKQGVSTAAHSDGTIIFFALSRREKTDGDDETIIAGKLPDARVPRFLSIIEIMQPYNTPVMVEAREGGVFPPDLEGYGKVIEQKNAYGVFNGKVKVEIHWQSSINDVPLMTFDGTQGYSWLTHNYVMNHCYNQFFGRNPVGSFKLGSIVKEDNTKASTITWGTISRYVFNTNWQNDFSAPTYISDIPYDGTIMYNYGEPAYYVKFTAVLDNLKNSKLAIYWANDKVCETKVSNTLVNFDEIKFGAQNYVYGTPTHKYFCWPRFGDRLDDLTGAEMESRVVNNTVEFYYRVKRLVL